MVKQWTASDMGRVGGRRRASLHTKAELSAWSKLGGRPVKLDSKALARLGRMLAKGKTQGQCAAALGVCPRTIGRILAKQKAERKGEKP
jgi:hypothetical protein